MGIRAVTNCCEVQLIVPNENIWVTFRPVYSSKDFKRLGKVAVKLQNKQPPEVISTINEARVSSTNGELAQRYNSDRKRGLGNSSTGYTPEVNAVNCIE